MFHEFERIEARPTPPLSAPEISFLQLLSKDVGDSGP